MAFTEKNMKSIIRFGQTSFLLLYEESAFSDETKADSQQKIVSKEASNLCTWQR